MQVLKKRTTIRTEGRNTTKTTGWIIGSSPELSHDETFIMAGSLAESSTLFQLRGYTPELSSGAKEILIKIMRFRNLPENWDGFGAIPPDDNVINRAIVFLQKGDEHDLPVYFTAPGPNGEVVLEYKEGNLSAEIYFEADNEAEMILYDGKKQKFSGIICMDKFVDHFTSSALEA